MPTEPKVTHSTQPVGFISRDLFLLQHIQVMSLQQRTLLLVALGILLGLTHKMSARPIVFLEFFRDWDPVSREVQVR